MYKFFASIHKFCNLLHNLRSCAPILYILQFRCRIFKILQNCLPRGAILQYSLYWKLSARCRIHGSPRNSIFLQLHSKRHRWSRPFWVCSDRYSSYRCKWQRTRNSNKEYFWNSERRYKIWNFNFWEIFIWGISAFEVPLSIRLHDKDIDQNQLLALDRYTSQITNTVHQL